MKKISIVIPMYFEEKTVEQAYKRTKEVFEKLEKYSYEIICIDDGSKDNTLPIIEKIANIDSNVKVISFSRNFGHQAAITAGLKYTTGDAVVIMDCDMQDPPELIPEMIELWEAGNDVIYAKRKIRKGENKFKLYTAKMFYKLLNGISEIKIPEDTGDFRLADRKVIDVINELPEHNKYLRGLFTWVGFKQVPIEYERQERFAGKTKYSLSKMIKLASDGITSFSKKPLKILGGFGALAIIASILLFIYAIISYVFELNSLMPGWTSIMITITFFGGLQLISVWLMSEYIGKIFDESKNRPEYIIAKKINID